MTPVVRNSISLFLAYSLARALAFALTVILPRYFPDEIFGAYAFAVSFANMMVVFTELGMQAPLIREMAARRSEASRLASNALTIRMILCLLTFGAITLYLNLMGYSPRTIRIAYIVALSELINSLSQLFRSVFRAFERMAYEAVTVALDRAMVLGIGLLLVTRGYGMEAFCWSMAGVSLFILMVTAALTQIAFVRVMPAFSPKVWRRLMEWSLPFALANVLNMVYFKLGILMLSKLSPHGEVAVAWYNVGYAMIMALLVLPGAFSGAIYPEISRLFAEKNGAKLQLFYHTSLKLMAAAGLPMALMLFAGADDIVKLFYGPSRFPEGTVDAALRVLAWSGLFSFLNAVIASFYRAGDRRRAFTIAIGSTAAVNLILNSILIPRMDHVGAALAMASSELFFLAAGLIYMRKVLGLRVIWREIYPVLICSAALGGYLAAVRGMSAALIPLGGIGYGAALMAVGAVRFEELRRLQA